MSDSTLDVLGRAQDGDEPRREILIERALPSVRRWARGRLPRSARDDANTEDVVQDAFLRTLRRIARFQHRTVGGLQAYLRQAVVNRIRDLIRGSKRRGMAGAVDSEPRDWKPSPLEAAIMREQLDAFLAALRRSGLPIGRSSSGASSWDTRRTRSRSSWASQGRRRHDRHQGDVPPGEGNESHLKRRGRAGSTLEQLPQQSCTQRVVRGFECAGAHDSVRRSSECA